MNQPQEEPRSLKWLQAVFFVWTGVGLVIMALGAGPETIQDHLPGGPGKQALLAIERSSDAMWIILAAFTAGWLTVHSYGWKTALIPGVVIGLGSALAEWIGASTGFPFGDYQYSDAFGLRIRGVLPFTIPLAWYAVVTGAVGGARLLMPGATGRTQALAAASLATLTDFNLEEVAWKIRGYWEWYPNDPDLALQREFPPPGNFISWFILAFAFSLLLTKWEKTQDRKIDQKRLTILILMNAVFIAARLGA